MSKDYLKRREPGALDRLVNEIKEKGKGKRFDCIIGVSGGVDSTYTAYITNKLKLRTLAVHLDNGWDSELAVSNIEKTLKRLGIDLYTYVIDWDEFRDLQLAFLKSSTPDSEIPTDHAIHAILYKTAVEEDVEFILIGRNTATECGGVPAWSQGHGDWRYIKGISKQFGLKKLKSFPHYGPMELLYFALKGIKNIPILDYTDYDKKTALQILKNELCWKDYGAKHFESIYTRFYQGFILPKKFRFNKKRLHLSSLVWSGQITREKALEEMEVDDYPLGLQEEDREYVIKKLGISPEEFEKIMSEHPKSFWDYPSYKSMPIFHSKQVLAFYHRLKRI
jgi:N-acetyl sugar amidotransferase